MISNRNRNIVVKSQFNINGSRGKDAGAFVADYVSRDSATDKSMAYLPDPNRVPVQGDGVAFTLDSTAISRDETLQLADHIQDLHTQGDRAIQQMVISFDPDYLVEQGIVPDDIEITNKGDYEYNYDDVRLRHAVRRSIQALVDNEGYNDGRMVAAIQHDTLHLHVHAVVYENHPKLARKRGYEEKGVIKESSFNQLAFELDRNLSLTRLPNVVPTQNELTPSKSEKHTHTDTNIEAVDTPYVDMYLRLLEQQKREAELQNALEDILTEVYDGDDSLEINNSSTDIKAVDIERIADNIDIENTKKEVK